MSLKWKEISLLIEEAKPLLVGSVLQKIAQVRELAGGESFLFQGFGQNSGWKLWVSLLQNHTCWVLADSDWELEAQPEPSVFVMVLRKHLLGKKITGLEQVAAERILLMHFEHAPSLLVELMPRKANLLLVENWDSASRTARCVQSFRTVSLETGALYRLPAPPAVAIPEEHRDFGGLETGPLAYHRAVAAHYWAGVQKTGFAGYQRLWRQAWKSHTKKVNTALENSRKDLAESQEAELFHQRGMALVTHLYELGPKALPKTKIVELDGLEIPLDLAKSFSENAEACFRKSKKMNRAVHELEGRLRGLEEKSADLAKVTAAIEAAKTEEELEGLAEAFVREGVPLPERAGEVEEKKAPAAKPYLEVQSSEGFVILCGRNQAENRRVTFHESKGNDLWLHVKGLPGAHVVVKAQKNKTVPLATLLEAAQLCLYHSKIRKGKRAEVDYTFRKYVRAIKGTVAEVTYTENKALYVEADPDALKKLMRG